VGCDLDRCPPWLGAGWPNRMCFAYVRPRQVESPTLGLLLISHTHKGVDMEGTHSRPAKIGLIAALIVAIMSLTALFASGASASETPYCGGWLAPKHECGGAPRWFNGQYGTGAQGSVCVYNGVYGGSCSTNVPGSGVYVPLPEVIYAAPGISNNMSCCNNLVHGTTFAP
jgi:hypothetical protein